MMSGIDSYPAKIVPPAYTQVLIRERLFRLLDEKREHPCVWVSGPAGAGKTTLVSSYAANRHVNLLWYQIDQGDSDPATLFYYLGLACRQAGQRTAEALPLYSPAYVSGTRAFSRRFFEQLFAAFEQNSLIVFDNYQDVSVDAGIQGILKHTIEQLPRHINMVFLSRSAAPKGFARALANNRIASIDAHRLRFTLRETGDLVKMAEPLSFDAAQVKKIHALTDGWAAGIILYLRKRPEKDAGFWQSTQVMTPTEIFDYFSEEIFDCVDDRVRHLLTHTAFFPQMTADMAGLVTGFKDARDVLVELVRSNYFINLRHREKPVFQYHPLFREFLQKRAAKTFEASAVASLKIRTARAMEQGGWWEAALKLYTSAGAFDQAARLILDNAGTMIATGRHQTLHARINKLPEKVVGKNTWLGYWQGISLIPTDPEAAMTILKSAYTAFKDQGDLSGRLNVQCAILESITYRFDRLGFLDQWLVKDDRFLSRSFDHIGRKEQMRCVFAVLNALAFSHPGQIDYDLWENRGMRLISSNTDPILKIHISLPMLAYQIYKGDFSKGFDIINNHPPIDDGLLVPPLIMVSLYALKTSLFWHAGRFEESRATSKAGLQLSEETGVHLVAFMTYVNAAQSAMSQGDLAYAAKLFDKMRSRLHAAGRYEKAYWHINRVWWHLLHGDIALASENADKSVDDAIASGCRKIEPIACLGKAITLRLLGKKSEAAKVLKHAFALCETLNTRHTLFACHLAVAEFSLKAGRTDALKAALQQAFALAKEKGYLTSFYWRNDIMAELCAHALNMAIEPDVVQTLIRKRGLVAHDPGTAPASWPWPVKVSTLGQFSLTVDGTPFEFSGRVRQKPFDLLKVLIALDGNEGVAEHVLQDVLWPQAEGDAAGKSYAVTLHRLRRLLGCKHAIRVSGGRVFLDDRYIQVDIRVLKKTIKTYDAQLTKTDDTQFPENAIRALNRILDLFGGEFLPGDQTYAIIMAREALKTDILDRIIALSRKLERLGAWEAAAQWLKKGLSVQNCSEYCYRQMIVCYRKLGMRAEARMIYEQCVRVLSEKLDIDPSPATVAEADKLKK